jgi:hypothetical protein
MYGQSFLGGAVRGGRSTSSHHRGTRPPRSGQTVVYPACATEQEALQCVLFVHDNATRILGCRGDALSPIVYVSCAATLRDIMAGNGTGRGVFAPDTRAKSASGAKAYLPGFCITLRKDHYFTTATGAPQMETAGEYQAQFHWHEGEGRLTLDPVSKRTADSSSRRSVSHPFAYHGLPYLLEPVFRAWQEGHPRCAELPGPAKLNGGLSLQDFHPVIQAQFLGVQFTETGDWSPAWDEAGSPPRRPMPHLSPRATQSSLPSAPRKLFVTPPRGSGKGPAALSTPPSTVHWNTHSTAPSPTSSSRSTPPRSILLKAGGGTKRGASRWSPEKPKQVHWGTGTHRILGQPGKERRGASPNRPHAGLPAHAVGPPPRPWPNLTGAQDAVTVLQKLTSFMALRDPELLAAAASAVGADRLIPHLHAWEHHPVDSSLTLIQEQPAASTEEKLRQQEDELAILQSEAEATMALILEARSQAEAEAASAAAAAARVADEIRRAAEAARVEEARQASLREEAARASALAAETSRLAAAQAIAEARELEHRLAVQAALALKARQDEELAKTQAANEAAMALAQREQALAAAREHNAQLAAELDRTRQQALLARRTAATEAAEAAALQKLAEKDARRRRQHEDLQRLKTLRLAQEKKLLLCPVDSTASTSAPPAAQMAAMQDTRQGRSVLPQRERDATPLRRPEKGLRDRSSRSPLGRPSYVDDKTRYKATRVNENESRREADRSAVVEERRARSPIFSAELQAMIATEDAVRRSRGLPPHTMESFLLHLHEQVNQPQAAHQNAAPQDPMEQDLQVGPGRSQGAPAEGLCQEGRQ